MVKKCLTLIQYIEGGVKTIINHSRFLVALSLCFVALTGCAYSDNMATPTTTVTTEHTQGDWIRKKLDDYTRLMFRYVEKLEITENENEYRLVLSFVPEVGSAPIKELIYHSMAEYAWSIHQFFPEVVEFDFHVLWDEHSKQDVIQASIDEDGVDELNNNYLNVKMDQKAQLETSWRNIFSNITENEISKKWHEKDSGV